MSFPLNNSKEASPTILIVDDNRLNREMLRLHLKKYDYSFLFAGDGLEAKHILEEHTASGVDLILLDLMMPNMDGFEFLNWRKTSQDMLSVPVIVNSSLDDFESIAKALTMDSYDYFTKPLHQYDLDIILPLKIRNAINAKRFLAAISRQNSIMRNELEMAARYQQFLLPDGVDLPGVKVSYMFQPCSNVGGDYFDFWALAEGEICFVLTDATGHGVSAAMTASIVKALLPGYMKGLEGSPAKAMLALNDDLLRLTQEDCFVTAASVCYDRHKSLIRWCLAGHPSPVFVPRDQPAARLHMNSMFLGMFPSGDPIMEDMNDHVLSVRSGDRLIVYSDGLTEAPDAGGEGFGIERLMAIMEHNRHEELDAVRDIIWQEVRAHVKGELPDDVAYIVMEF